MAHIKNTENITTIHMTTTVFGVPLFAGSKQEALKYIKKHLLERSLDTFLIMTPNTEQVMLAQHNAKFLAALKQADLALPDGMGLVFASHILSNSQKGMMPLKSRISGREMMVDILEPEYFCRRKAPGNFGAAMRVPVTGSISVYEMGIYAVCP